MEEKHCTPLSSFISTLNTISDFVDVDTKDHSRGTKHIAVEIGKRMEWTGDNLLFLGYGADIHDIGKVAISPVVFRQPSKLTKGQYAAVKHHPTFGMEMIQVANLPLIINDCVLYHHEHWNGDGYPFRLVGDQIPECAAITCIADVWESICNDRPYRLAMPRPQAIDFMKEHSDWFSPSVYEVFRKLVEEGVL